MKVVGGRKRPEHAGFAVMAFTQLSKKLRSYLGRRVPECDVDDLAQTVYLRLLNTDAAQVKESVRFVLGVATHVVADYWEREGKHSVASEGDALEVLAETPSDALGDRLEDCLSVAEQIDDALSKLSPMHRTVLLLLHREGLTYEETADKLGVKVSMVHTYATDARAKIRMAHWRDE
jgi:RNA polymerase sigma factor, sigma-70 family